MNDISRLVCCLSVALAARGRGGGLQGAAGGGFFKARATDGMHVNC